MQWLFLIFIKILDNIILTAKTITTYQNKKILSSLLVVISQFIFYSGNEYRYISLYFIFL